jgi:hypothetical protein
VRPGETMADDANLFSDNRFTVTLNDSRRCTELR